MRLLALISWPYARKHLLRSVLTTAGIVLGVALLVAMRSANQTVLSSFTQTVEHIAGKSQLQVSAGDAGFPEEVLERVQALPEVRAAAPVIEATAEARFQGQGRLLILAVDMTGDRSLRDYDFDSGQEDVIDDPLLFLAQPDSLIVTRDFATRNSLTTGSPLLLDTMVGERRFTVRGILKPGGMAQAFGGNLGIMDIYAAQQVFGRGRHFDRVDIGLQDGVPLERGQAALQRALGPGYEVEPPSGRGRHFENLLAVYAATVNISSLFALFIGMFLIYNSFAIAVTQRRSEIGILRALGATRGQVRWLFLAESALAGLVGSAIGIAAGLWAAGTLTRLTAGLMESIYGAMQSAEGVIVEPRSLLVAAVLGVLTSMLAAWIPARAAASIEPVQALQKGKYQVLAAGESARRRTVALAALVAALVCLALGKYTGAFYIGYLMVVLAALLLAPFLALSLARLLRVPLQWIRPVEGALAADSLIQAPRRTSATVAALMLSLALVIGQGGIARASYASINAWAEGALNPDLFVSTSDTLAARQYHFPATMENDLTRIEGVAEVQPVRTLRVNFRNSQVMVIGLPAERVAARVRRSVVEGDPSTMYARSARGEGVTISDNLSALQRLHVGDRVDLPTPSGVISLPVLGVIQDFSNQVGSIFLDRTVFIRYFQDDAVDIFRVYLKPGADPVAVKARINENIGRGRRLFVLLNADVRRYIDRLTGQWIGMTYIQVLVAVLVAILGIFNTLTVSISDRRRELGVLRAVGGLRAQIRGTVWMEALAIGVIGLALGLAVGALQLYYLVRMVQHDFTGMNLGYHFPFGVALLLAPVVLVAALAAALAPAEKAVRTSLVEALEYE